MRMLTTLIRALVHGLGATAPGAGAPTEAVDALQRAAHDDSDAPSGRDSGLDGAAAFGLEGYISEEDEAARVREDAEAEKASRNQEQDEKAVVLEPTVPTGTEDQGEAGDPAGEEPEDDPEAELLRVGEEPAKAPVGQPAGDAEAAALNRLRALHPNTPDAAIVALRQLEKDAEAARAAAQEATPAVAILRRLGATPEGRKALATFYGQDGSADPSADGAPGAAGAGAGGGLAPAASQQVPTMESIAQGLASADPDKVLQATKDLERRSQLLVQQGITALVQQQQQQQQLARAHAGQHEYASREMAALDKVLGPEWQRQYGDKALASLRRMKGASLAECVLVNAAAAGDLKTVAKLSPRSATQAGRRQFQEGPSAGERQGSTAASSAEARFLRGLGIADEYRGKGGRGDTPDEGFAW